MRRSSPTSSTSSGDEATTKWDATAARVVSLQRRVHTLEAELAAHRAVRNVLQIDRWTNANGETAVRLVSPMVASVSPNSGVDDLYRIFARS